MSVVSFCFRKHVSVGRLLGDKGLRIIDTGRNLLIYAVIVNIDQ